MEENLIGCDLVAAKSLIMKYNFILAILFIGFTFPLCSQATIQGIVSDNKENLVSATVVLLSEKDSTLTGFGLTNNKGLFRLHDINSGEYLLQVTYLGYEQLSKKILVPENQGTVDLGVFTLQQTASQIDQVTIEGERAPIQVKKDTIEYNADAFKTQPNDVVEDLLKRLPGVEVESDGSIKAQGEDVEQVLVDGKEFFGKDPKIATRNLPADAVEKVQIYDKKSDMAEFSGVDDGEREKTINLELKEDRKNGTFGSLTAGYGTEERYNGRLSLNRFSSKMQLSAIGNFNNVNEQGFSVNDYISFMGGMGNFSGGGRNSGIPISSGLSNGFVDTKAGGLNLNYDLSSKTELSISYFLNAIDNSINESSTRENFLDEGSYITSDLGDQFNTSDNHRVNFRIEHEIDSTQELRINTSFINNNGLLNSISNSVIYDTSNEIENTVDRTYDSTGDNLNVSGSALYRKKIGNGGKSTFTLRGSLNQADSNTDANLDSNSEFFPDDPIRNFSEILVQNQLQNDDKTNYRFEGAFVRPIKGNNFIEFKYIRQNFNDEIIRDVYDDLSGDLVLNEPLSSHYTRDFVYDRISAAIHMNSEKSQLTMEGAIQNSGMDGDIISENLLIEKNTFRVLPRLSWRYELGQSHNIRFRYSTSVREPSLSQLQPITDNTDPQNIYIGNPDLVPEYSHRVRLNYVNYDQFSFRSFFAFINASYTKNNITNKTTKEVGRQIYQSVNVDYNLNLSGSLSFGTPIRALGIKTNIRTRFGMQTGPIFLNDTETDRNSYNGNIFTSIENRKKEVIDWELGGSWGYNVTNYQESNTQNQKYFNQSVYADFTYNLKNSFSLETNMDVNFYSEQAFGEEQIIPIWKASISKYILKDQRGELKLSVFDILNQNLGIERNSNLNYIENSEVVSLSRFFLLSFTYSIKKAGQSSGKSRVMFSRG